MAQLWTTGPAHLFVGAAGSSPGAALYCGTADEKPTIDVDFLFKPVMNDVAGDVSMDEMYVGMKGMVTCDFGRYNYAVLEALTALPNISATLSGGGPVPGRNDPGDIGTLMLTEGQNFILYVAFPYVLKPAMGGGAAGQMVAGYRFPACMTNKHSPKVGTQPHNRRLIIDCKRTFDTSVANVYGRGRFILYDNNALLSTLPAIN